MRQLKQQMEREQGPQPLYDAHFTTEPSASSTHLSPALPTALYPLGSRSVFPTRSRSSRRCGRAQRVDRRDRCRSLLTREHRRHLLWRCCLARLVHSDNRLDPQQRYRPFECRAVRLSVRDTRANQHLAAHLEHLQDVGQASIVCVVTVSLRKVSAFRPDQL